MHLDKVTIIGEFDRITMIADILSEAADVSEKSTTEQKEFVLNAAIAIYSKHY